MPLALAALALMGAGLVGNLCLSITMISLTLAGLYAFKSPFWALPTLFLSREAASVSIAVINSIGNLGGFVGLFLIGYVKGRGNRATTGLLFLASLLVISFLMTWRIKIREQKAQAFEMSTQT